MQGDMTKEEQAALEKKFEDVVREYINTIYGGTMTAFVVIAHSMVFDKDANSFSMYPVEVPLEQPRHVTTGLLELGREAIEIGHSWHDEDDEDD